MTKKQGYSTVVCFITVSIITIILLLNGFIIHAEGSNYLDAYGIGYENFYLYDYPYLDTDYYVCMTSDQYRSSSIYDSDVSSRMVQMQSLSTLDTYIWNHQDISNEYFINVLKASIPSDISPSEYPYFIIQKDATDISDNSFDVFFLSENANLICFSSYGFVSSEDGSDLKLSAYTYSNGVYTQKGGYTNPVESSVVGIGTVFYVYYSNMPILVSDTSFSNFYDGVSYFRSNPDNFVDQNYLLYDVQGNPNYTNPNLNGSGSMSEDIEKGLYLLKGSCIYLENKSFNDGTLHVNALFSDIQKSNPNLQVRVKGTCTYSFEQTSQSSVNTRIYVGEYSNSGDSSLFGILWPGENYTTTHTKTVNCTYGLLGSDIISIDSFDGGTFTKPLSQVNSSMFTNDIGGYTMATFGGANIRPIANAFDNANTNQFIIRNMSINTGTPISFNTGFLDESKQKTDVYLTDVKYNFELYVVDVSDSNNIEWSDVIYSYSIDMLNGTASVGTDGTLTYDDLDNNFDGDIPSEYLPSNDVNSTGGSSSSSSGGNTQIVTVNGDDSAKYLPSLINKLVPSSEGDGGLSEDFQNLTNSNGWIQYMSATLSFVPAEFWTNLNTYFVTFIGIIGVAFIIRIILDLL